MAREPFALDEALVDALTAAARQTFGRWMDEYAELQEALTAPLPSDDDYQRRVASMTLEELGEEYARLVAELEDNGARLHNLVSEMEGAVEFDRMARALRRDGDA